MASINRARKLLLLDPRQELSNRANLALDAGLPLDESIFWAQYGFGTEFNGLTHDPSSESGARFERLSRQISEGTVV